jgi:hypothetical protein
VNPVRRVAGLFSKFFNSKEDEYNPDINTPEGLLSTSNRELMKQEMKIIENISNKKNRANSFKDVIEPTNKESKFLLKS